MQPISKIRITENNYISSLVYYVKICTLIKVGPMLDWSICKGAIGIRIVEGQLTNLNILLIDFTSDKYEAGLFFNGVKFV